MPLGGSKFLDGKDTTQMALASAAILIHLIRHLIESKALERAKALALLGAAADDLAAGTRHNNQQAAELIRKEIVPNV